VPAIDDAANAIVNATIATEIGNVAVEVRPETIRLRGAGDLSLDIQIPSAEQTQSPEPVPPPGQPPGP
jgi:hypothetical protein